MKKLMFESSKVSVKFSKLNVNRLGRVKRFSIA